MPIYKWVRDFVEKYSFITGSELRNGMVYFYYEKEGKKRYKRIPFRSDKDKVISTIERIKEDIGYDEQKAVRDVKVRKAIKEDDENKDKMIFGFA